MSASPSSPVYAMGTRISVELWNADAALATECSARIIAEMERIEALMSTYRDDSEITYINDNAAASAVEIDIKTEATLLLEPDIEYDVIVQVMDTLRVVNTMEDGMMAKAELFPDITIGDAPPGASPVV